MEIFLCLGMRDKRIATLTSNKGHRYSYFANLKSLQNSKFSLPFFAKSALLAQLSYGIQTPSLRMVSNIESSAVKIGVFLRPQLFPRKF